MQQSDYKKLKFIISVLFYGVIAVLAYFVVKYILAWALPFVIGAVLDFAFVRLLDFSKTSLVFPRASQVLFLCVFSMRQLRLCLSYS